MYKKLPKALQQFVKYFVVGSIATLVDVGFLHLFFKILSLNFMFSVVLGFMSGNIVSFYLNKYFTFQNYSKKIVRQYTKYFVTSMLGLLLTMGLMYLFYNKLRLFSAFVDDYHLPCKLLVALIVMFWNFLVIRTWTLASSLVPNLSKVKTVKSEKYFLSVVIPAYNEEKRLPATIKDVIAYLQKQSYTWEIVIVDDGSKDNTVSVAKKICENIANVTVFSLAKNSGKGAAVKAGMQKACGKYRLFMDADNQIQIKELDNFLPIISENKVIIGSKYKENEESIKKISFIRKFISRTGNYVIRILFDLPIKDTQCGFKLFPGKLADYIFKAQSLNTFVFDVEVLSLANLMGCTVIEQPITLIENDDSRVSALKDSIKALISLASIKLKIWNNYYANIIKKTNLEN